MGPVVNNKETNTGKDRAKLLLMRLAFSGLFNLIQSYRMVGRRIKGTEVFSWWTS